MSEMPERIIIAWSILAKKWVVYEWDDADIPPDGVAYYSERSYQYVDGWDTEYIRSDIHAKLEAKIAHLDLVNGHCECVAVLEQENAKLEAELEEAKGLLKEVRDHGSEWNYRPPKEIRQFLEKQ